MKPGWYVIQQDEWSRSVLGKRYKTGALAKGAAEEMNGECQDMYFMFIAEYCGKGDLPNETTKH